MVHCVWGGFANQLHSCQGWLSGLRVACVSIGQLGSPWGAPVTFIVQPPESGSSLRGEVLRVRGMFLKPAAHLSSDCLKGLIAPLSHGAIFACVVHRQDIAHGRCGPPVMLMKACGYHGHPHSVFLVMVDACPCNGGGVS